MKQKLKEIAKHLNNRMFDVAAAPMFIMLFGVPAVIGLIIGLLIWFAVKTVMKIYQDKKAKDREQ